MMTIIIKIDIFTASTSSVFHLLSGEWQLIFSWGIVGIFILPTNSESLINCSSETERVWYSLILGWLVSLYCVCFTYAKLLKCFQKAVNIEHYSVTNAFLLPCSLWMRPDHKNLPGVKICFCSEWQKKKMLQKSFRKASWLDGFLNYSFKCILMPILWYFYLNFEWRDFYLWQEYFYTVELVLLLCTSTTAHELNS